MASEMTAEVRRCYQAIRRGMPEHLAVTLLHIGELESAVAVGTTAAPQEIVPLAIGSRKTAQEFFLHTPPTPGELENAIQQVENEIGRVRGMGAGYTLYVAADAALLGEIARIAGAEDVLSRDGVEYVFSLLAAHSLGRPGASAGIPDNAPFAATLLILREFMHHGGALSASIVE